MNNECITLEEALKRFPNFKPNWSFETTNVGGRNILNVFENPKFGAIIPCVIVKDGKPMYDQFMIDEGPINTMGTRVSGSIVLPYFESDGTYNLGLVDQVRPVVRDGLTGKQGNYRSIEAPRGFADLGEKFVDVAKREMGEETGLVSDRLHKIGRLNPSTTYYTASNISVFAAEVGPTLKSHLRPDTSELISRCEFRPIKEVYRMMNDGTIYCGMTHAAIGLFNAFISTHK